MLAALFLKNPCVGSYKLIVKYGKLQISLFKIESEANFKKSTVYFEILSHVFKKWVAFILALMILS